MAFPFENKINSTIQEFGMINESDSVLVAVSGGLDSMCLARVLKQLRFKIGIAHVNFKLRGKESDLDEEMIRNWSREIDVPFYTIDFDTTTIARESKTGIQETARKLRYEWFDQLCQEFGYNKIATGHHLDDQAETILFNLIRGAGIQGAKGISRINGNIIRPQCGVSKVEIIQYIQDQKIPFREDASNSKTTYSRNKIRHDILPNLNLINPKSTLHLAQFGWRLQDLLPGYEQWKKSIRDQYLEKTESGYQVKLVPSLDASLLYFILEEFHFNSTQIDQLRQSLSQNDKGKKFISPEYELYYSGQYLDIRKLDSSNRPVNIQIEHLPFSTIVGSKSLNLEYTNETVHSGFSSQIDIRHHPLPFTLRCWLPGDRFAPSGMDGKTKKIQDYLTDIKLSGFDKKNALVLISKEEIIWVWPAGRSSESVKPRLDGTLMNIIWTDLDEDKFNG